MIRGIVFLTINTVNNKGYVGQTTRIYKKNYLGSGTNLKPDIKKYGKENFIRHTIENVNGGQEILNNRETFWIQQLIPEYNKMKGASGAGTCDEETKQLISEAQMGNQNAKGCKRSKETKQLMSESRIGYIVTKETKKKIGKSVSGEKNGMYKKSVYDIWIEKYGKKEADKKWKEKSKKISESNKGKIGYWEGKKMNKEIRKQMSNSRKGRIPWNKGLTKETDERVRNMSETLNKRMIGNQNAKGKKRSEKFKQICRKRMMGNQYGKRK